MPVIDLVDLVEQLTGVDDSEIMLLRHSNADVDALRACGAKVKEHTAVQPTGSKYDYLEVGVSLVAVIVYEPNDRVDYLDGIYRVVGKPKNGTMDSLASVAYRRFRKQRRKPREPGRRFRIKAVLSQFSDKRPVTGWEGRHRTTIQRKGGKFFREINIKLPSVAMSLPDYEGDQDEGHDSLKYTPHEGDRRQVVERQIRERRGQQHFRDALRDRYGDRCMVTGCKVLDVLEASHIKPYRGEDDNHPENGLLLRTDIQTCLTWTCWESTLIGCE